MRRISQQRWVDFLLSFLIAFFILGGFHDCVFNRVLGFQCPGCGAYDAVLYCLQRNWGAAYQANALFVISVPVIAIVLLYKFICWIRGRQPMLLYKIPSVVFIIILLAILAFAVARVL